MAPPTHNQRQPRNKIPRQKKKIYLKKARRQARRQFAPERKLIRRQMRQLERTQERELASVGGAIGQFSDVVAQAQAGLDDSGLKGRYLKQTAAELANRAADAAQAAPALRSQIRQEFRPEFASLRDALSSNRMEQSQTAQTTYKTMLADQMERMQERRQEAAEAGPGREGIKIGLQLATLNHERNMRLLQTPDSDLDEKQRAEKELIQEAMEDPDYYWREIASQSAGEGTNPLEATRAVGILRNQLDDGMRGALATGAVAAAQAVAPPSLFELWRRTQER